MVALVQNYSSRDYRHSVRKVSPLPLSKPHNQMLHTTKYRQRLSDSIRQQYDILDQRLSEPGQEYIALADRPTIADFANLPFANAQIASTAGYDFNDWPKLKVWSEEMLSRPAVKRALARAQTFGVEAADIHLE